MVPVAAQPVVAVNATAVRTGRRPSIAFLGGVGTSAGSKFLRSTAASTVLVDCGLFQGHKEWRLGNRAELPFDVGSLDPVAAAHAHVDHLRYLPALTRAGLGRAHHPLLLPTVPLVAVETVLVESTYGDRLHDVDDCAQQLADAATRTAARGGSVIFPSFAVDRTEVVLMRLRQLIRVGAIPDLPVFVDSAMALEALRAYRRRSLNAGRRYGPRPSAPMTRSTPDSCASAGRPRSRRRSRSSDTRRSSSPRRARQPADGCSITSPLEGFSLHADQAGLVAWLSTAPGPPRTCFVVHGEPSASAGLADAIHDRLGWRAIVPSDDEPVLLSRRPSKPEGVSP